MSDIKWDAPEAMQRMLQAKATGAKPDYTVTSAKLVAANEVEPVGFVIAWETESAGFGQVTIQIDEEGNTIIDAETMGRDFVKAVFAKLVDSIRGDCWL